MIKKEVIILEGCLDASVERQEASITEFQENSGFIDETCYELIDVLSSLDGRQVKIVVTTLD